MRVTLDAHMIGAQETGNETYVLNLWRALAATPGMEVTGVVGRSLGIQAGPAGCNMVRLTSDNDWARILWGLGQVVEDSKADLLHVTYVGPLRARVPFVVTVHDVAFRRHPEFFSPRDRLLFATLGSLSIQRASAVITLSQHARREISDFYPGVTGRLHVTPLAPGPSFVPGEPALSEDLKRRWGINAPFLLAVGNLQSRKNLVALLEAYSAIRAQIGPSLLVIVGRDGRNATVVRRRVAALGLSESCVLTGYVAEEELVTLYRSARLFVYPSVYEGFGLPVVEAMACGTPVISSNRAAMPEVAGDAAMLVDPGDSRELGWAICELWENEALCDTLRHRGLERARKRTWKDVAEDTVSVYRRTLGESSD